MIVLLNRDLRAHIFVNFYFPKLKSFFFNN